MKDVISTEFLRDKKERSPLFLSYISNNVMIAHYDGEVQKEDHDIKRNNFVVSF